MKLRRLFVLTAAVALMGLGVVAQATGFTDSFDTLSTEWITDRAEPSAFTIDDGRLIISVDAPAATGVVDFYNTQGRSRSANLTPGWVVSGDVYVSEDMLSGNNLRRTDLWARTGVNGTESNVGYPIIGLRRFDASDAFNTNAAGISTVWRAWGASGWVNLAAEVTGGWHTLSITGDGSSLIYKIDGATAYTDTTIIDGYQNLTNVYVQAYNFGSNQDYTAYWDNVSATSLAPVPEPGTILAALSILGPAGVLFRRRRA